MVKKVSRRSEASPDKTFLITELLLVNIAPLPFLQSDNIRQAGPSPGSGRGEPLPVRLGLRVTGVDAVVGDGEGAGQGGGREKGNH